MGSVFKILLALLFVMVFCHCKASNIEAISKILKQKDYNKLNTYLSSLSEDCSVSRLIEREVMPDCWEVKIQYQEFYPGDEPGVTTVNSYYIEILTEKGQIVYCCFSDHKYLNAPETILNYKVDKEYKKLSEAHQDAYGAELNFSHLFVNNDSIVYGSHCGWAGINPGYRSKLDDAVKLMDTALLNAWLSSTITELQVYAVDGFYQLKQKGYVPDDKTLERIALVKSKKGTINQCSGCIYMNREISEATADFKF